MPKKRSKTPSGRHLIGLDIFPNEILSKIISDVSDVDAILLGLTSRRYYALILHAFKVSKLSDILPHPSKAHLGDGWGGEEGTLNSHYGSLMKALYTWVPRDYIYCDQIFQYRMMESLLSHDPYVGHWHHRPAHCGCLRSLAIRRDSFTGTPIQSRAKAILATIQKQNKAREAKAAKLARSLGVKRGKARSDDWAGDEREFFVYIAFHYEDCGWVARYRHTQASWALPATALDVG
ncbi:uncharacterized protein HMPREF1541_07230 [Cyphellophora europaea CBS 101466]|uniref:F-box domain-containing protein n=1 Tax=Cyphellophora europaea (strain CBS 101466) TaxID=1220924 RepID=W2RPH2_CYPE1|nr:uncharacterized protein HMPREF1541_07230 [Cyphellophora europaea CBS 101466]ETN37608.1 hypothetical protein HMPREF1541_07230 [Cyphellophora europaea CBS 101466]